jgi:hypothetical protein
MANAKSEFFELQQQTKACRLAGIILLGALALFSLAWYLWLLKALADPWNALSLVLVWALILQTVNLFFLRMRTMADVEGIVIKTRYGLRFPQQRAFFPWGDIVSAEIVPYEAKRGLRRWNPFSFDLLSAQVSIGRYKPFLLPYRTAYFGKKRYLRYNMWSRTEVLLTTIHGMEVFIGTQQPEALLEFCRRHIKNK